MLNGRERVRPMTDMFSDGPPRVSVARITKGVDSMSHPTITTQKISLTRGAKLYIHRKKNTDFFKHV